MTQSKVMESQFPSGLGPQGAAEARRAPADPQIHFLRLLAESHPRDLEAARRLRGLGVHLIAARITPFVAANGHKPGDLPLPGGAQILGVGRGDAFLNEVEALAPNDTLFLLVAAADEEVVRRVLATDQPLFCRLAEAPTA